MQCGNGIRSHEVHLFGFWSAV